MRWAGLSADDRDLLGAFVGIWGKQISELHTDVPCGLVPVCPDDGDVEQFDALAVGCHALRVDALVLMRGVWHVLECKESAGYVAMGQVLCYAWWLRRTCPALRGCVPCVVTDECQPSLRGVYHSLGVSVFEVL